MLWTFSPHNKRLLHAFFGSPLVFLLAISGCREEPKAPVKLLKGKGWEEQPKQQSSKAAFPFEDQTETVGIDFTHQSGMAGEYFFCEIIGAGGALLDYDGDGDLDVYLVQGHPLGERPTDEAEPPRDRLFRNDLKSASPGNSDPRFTDVTADSGLDARGYGMGAAAGDYDNDGWPDLYITNFGCNQLYRNQGDGSFHDVTAAAGVDDPRWSVSAAFLDYDRDGFLDLYIGNYTNFTLATNKRCYQGSLDYCHPSSYEAVPDRLLHNEGDGSFRDVTDSAGLNAAYGRALGVVCADFNGDGWQDIYVANDGTANQLWTNQGDGTFRETAMLAGVAMNESGVAEASMGVAAGDFDGDGDDDLFMTHLRNETNTLYVNQGNGMFSDETVLTGLGAPSIPYTGFGTGFLDFDNDGWLDLYIANGAVAKISELELAGDPYPFHFPDQLFHNRGNGQFEDVSARSGPVFALSEGGRGAMFGDVDNDGDVDIFVVNNNGRARFFRNRIGNRNAWIGLRLRHPSLKRDAYGARVAIYRKDLPTIWRGVRADASYASASDPRVLIGLGGFPEIEKIQVLWPDGKAEEWGALSANHWHELVQGAGSSEE